MPQQAVVEFVLFIQEVGVTSGKRDHKHSHFTLKMHVYQWSKATWRFPQGPERTRYRRSQHPFLYHSTPYFHFPPPLRKGKYK